MFIEINLYKNSKFVLWFTLFDIWSIDWQLKKETINEAEYANMPNCVFKLKVQKMSRCCIILSIC
jgi:hypothetical protein